MRELPTKTTGVVSVRPLDRRHPASGQWPGAWRDFHVRGPRPRCKRQASGAQATPVSDRPRADRSVTIDDLEARATGPVPETSQDRPQRCRLDRRGSVRLDSRAHNGARGPVRLAGHLL